MPGGEAVVKDYLLCRLGPLRCAVPAHLLQASLVAHYGICGEVPFHGQRFPVADPRPLFDLPSGRGECQALLLAEIRPIMALLVDAVEEPAKIDERRFQPLPWHFSGRERLWISGLVAVGDDLLNPELIIRVRPEGLRASLEGTLGKAEKVSSYGIGSALQRA